MVQRSRCYLRRIALNASLHLVDLAVLAPATERLALPPEQDTEEAEEENQACVGHDWWNESV